MGGPDETWRPVVGLEGYYEVSDQGGVRRQPRILKDGRRILAKVLRPTLDARGYRTVWLSVDGKRHVRRVHRMMLESFVGPRPTNIDACHNNGIRDDNRLSNLRWDTRSGNIKDAVKHGTKYRVPASMMQRGSDRYNAILTEGDVERILDLKRSGCMQKDIASHFDVSWDTVSGIVLRKTWTHVESRAW